MMLVEDILKRWGRLYEAQGSEHHISLSGTVKWRIEGDAGGTWVITPTVQPEPCSSAQPADAEIVISVRDFMAIAANQLNPQRAFLQGRIKLSGDREVLLQFSRLLQELIDATCANDSCN